MLAFVPPLLKRLTASVKGPEAVSYGQLKMLDGTVRAREAATSRGSCQKVAKST